MYSNICWKKRDKKIRQQTLHSYDESKYSVILLCAPAACVSLLTDSDYGVSLVPDDLQWGPADGDWTDHGMMSLRGLMLIRRHQVTTDHQPGLTTPTQTCLTLTLAQPQPPPLGVVINEVLRYPQ